MQLSTQLFSIYRKFMIPVGYVVVMALGILCEFSLAIKPSKQTDSIVIWNRNADVPGLIEFVEMLAELSKDKYGAYSIVTSKPLEHGRMLSELTEGSVVNVSIMGAYPAREKAFLPIYYPVDRGLLGFRVCLINKKDNEAFKKIRNVSDLNSKELVIGSGTHWVDTKILRANNLFLMTVPVYKTLFKMLKRGRFDCFSRSLNEVIPEMRSLNDPSIAIEQNISLIYPAADLIFVSPQYPKLAERLSYGLRKAMANGQADQHYNEYYSGLVSELNFFKRRLIILENPFLSEKSRAMINDHGLISFEAAITNN